MKKLFILSLCFLPVFGMAQDVKTTQSNTKIELRRVNIEDVKFPKNIEKMNLNALTQACRVILDSYRALDYVSKLPSTLDKIEWHTWQISLLLHFLKMRNRLPVINKDKFFHPIILEISAEQRKDEMQKILNKYWDNANIEKDRDTLSRDVIWNAREVSIILYEILQQK